MQNKQHSIGANKIKTNTAMTTILDNPSIIMKIISKTSSGVLNYPTDRATIAKTKSVNPVNLVNPSNLSSP